jgi:ribokinase
MTHVLVFGSINMDLVAQARALPGAGETRLADTFRMTPGGKGANQAVAVARLGVPVWMIGRVGRDAFGDAALASLAAAGVRTAAVQRDAAATTGVALITVARRGENLITVVPGANGRVGGADVRRGMRHLAGAASLLLQLELPLRAVLAAARAARRAGVRVILDPAPVRPLPPALYRVCDIITPNEHEATALVGFPVTSRAAALRAARVLIQRGAAMAIIKRGCHGALCLHGANVFDVPALPVRAVDTVAAGDAFNGGLAAALARGATLPDALRFASATAARCVTQRGAQEAMPTRAAVAALLRRSAPGNPAR